MNWILLCLTSFIAEDIFTNALQTSEIDRRRDAWIPNEHTQTILNSVAQSQKRIKLEPKYLTRPGLATSESSGNACSFPPCYLILGPFAAFPLS